MAPIKGQSVLIIGGSSGIGFSIAKLALAEGAHVAIASSNRSKVETAVARLLERSNGCRVTGYTIDLTHPDPETHLEKLLSDASAEAALDHVVSTAGRAERKSITDLNTSSFLALSQMALFVPMLIGKLAPKYLRNAYTSSVTFTTGQVAEKPVPGYSVLASFGAGVHALARNLAVDLAPLRFNVVAPGPTDTELWGDYAELLREQVAQKSLLKRAASPDDVAEAYRYLMKNVDSTGAIVSSNGGATLQ